MKSFKEYLKEMGSGGGGGGGGVGATSAGPTNVTGPQSGTDPQSATAIDLRKKRKRNPVMMSVKRK